jgi:hypothetical protein
MRTIAADWSVPDRKQEERGSWLSNIGASIRNVRSARTARRLALKEVSVLSGRGSHDPFMQADVAAFISAFMRIG